MRLPFAVSSSPCDTVAFVPSAWRIRPRRDPSARGWKASGAQNSRPDRRLHHVPHQSNYRSEGKRRRKTASQVDVTIKRKHLGVVQALRRKRTQSGNLFIFSLSLSIKQHLKASNSVENDLIWPPARELHNGYLHRGAISWWLKSAKKGFWSFNFESQIEADVPLLPPWSLSPYGLFAEGPNSSPRFFWFFRILSPFVSLSYLNIKWIREICFSLYRVDISREIIGVFVAKMKRLCWGKIRALEK